MGQGSPDDFTAMVGCQHRHHDVVVRQLASIGWELPLDNEGHPAWLSDERAGVDSLARDQLPVVIEIHERNR